MVRAVSLDHQASLVLNVFETMAYVVVGPALEMVNDGAAPVEAKPAMAECRS
jgi:hypothetical protein